ncbi:hypothetical protein LCL89_06825 [Halobacillus yeomjeoni]|uniref:hypothetical protein n=1 Tax=Halobacillus yeomjeoni TaxID=311194 RepID=UPI001CD59EE9|nr:hypothetical protein [Halobacillus yeomjeoni]MCA0983770.1 hypothetical protein [Halobacillus yeomjeoni]
MPVIGGINLGNLTDYLFFFADGRIDANWQGASKGYVGDVAVDGLQADLRTSGTVPYAGTIFTNANTQGAWQDIIDDNPGQANGVTNQAALISALEADLISSIQQINALPATPGFESVSSTSLNGLDTTNGMNETFVINVTSGFNYSTKINITGDPGDVFILRWDTDADPSNGYQGQVKPQSGGAIVPHGGLTATNFIHVAGDINASGGGSTPAPPYPQGPRFDDGQGALINGGSDFSGGGFFTGYWLTTGAPTSLLPGTEMDPIYFGETSSFSNAIFVGGWYTLTTKFSMTSGTSGVYVSPNPATIEENEPAIDIEKFVSVDGGTTFFDADTPPGPILDTSTYPNVHFKYVVTNIGNEQLVDIDVTDNIYSNIILNQTLDPGESFQQFLVVPGVLGNNQNIGTVTGEGAISGTPVSDNDPANYIGVAESISIDVEKLVSPDGGMTFFDADNPPGPNVIFPQDPQFKFIVTNTGDETLVDVEITDNVFGTIASGLTLLSGESHEVTIVGSWMLGQQSNVATATGTGENSGVEVDDTDPAYYFGVEAGAIPSIKIEKLVSVNNGQSFSNADVSPGPLLPPGVTPQFKFIVTNNGETPLQNVSVVDNIYGFIGFIPNMVPGEVQEFILAP